jgi:hypothetical protein
MTREIEKLIFALRFTAPDLEKEAVEWSKETAKTQLERSFEDCLRWCVYRAMYLAPMPWVDPHWEERSKALLGSLSIHLFKGDEALSIYPPENLNEESGHVHDCAKSG